MRISMIAAIGQNYGIGHNGKIPWHLPKDFAWLKEKTMHKPIIMGRKTFESIGRALPKRLNIIISRKAQQFFGDNIAWAHSLEDALTIAKIHPDYQADELIIFGGGDIYSQALPLADRMYLTEVALSPPADAFFPAFDRSKWTKTIIAEHPAEDGQPAFTIAQYDRI